MYRSGSQARPMDSQSAAITQTQHTISISPNGQGVHTVSARSMDWAGTAQAAEFCRVARRIFGRDNIVSLSYASRARNLGLEVVAEGIETVMQFDQVKALGCEQGQGYYFSQPIGGELATELLQREQRGKFLDILGQTTVGGSLLKIT